MQHHPGEAKEEAAPPEREVEGEVTIIITYIYQKMKKTKQEMHWPMRRKHPRTHGSPAATHESKGGRGGREGGRRGKWGFDGRKAADCPKEKKRLKFFFKKKKT